MSLFCLRLNVLNNLITWYKDNANERNGIVYPKKLWIEDDNHQLK